MDDEADREGDGAREGGRDNHMVRVNLGNNQEGRSNLAKNFVYRQQKKDHVG